MIARREPAVRLKKNAAIWINGTTGRVEKGKGRTGRDSEDYRSRKRDMAPYIFGLLLIGGTPQFVCGNVQHGQTHIRFTKFPLRSTYCRKFRTESCRVFRHSIKTGFSKTRQDLCLTQLTGKGYW